MARKKNKQQLNDLAPLNFNPILETQTDINHNDDATDFFQTYNSPSLLDLAAMKDKATPNRMLKTNGLTGVFILNNERTIVSISQYYEQNSNLSTKDKKILDFCIMLLSSQTTYKKIDTNEYLLTFTLSYFLEVFGISNPSKQIRYRHRQQLEESLSKLKRTSIKMSKGKNSAYQSLEIGIVESYGVNNETIQVRLNTDFCHDLINSSISSIPLGLFKLSDNNKNAYVIGRKLASHYTMASNVQKDRHNIIGVKYLLKSAPDISDIETVRATDGRWVRRIKEALEKALDQLEDERVLVWEYCNPKKKPLTDKQLNIASYEEYEQLYIQFELLDFPENTMQSLKEKKSKKRKPAKKVTNKGE